LFRPVERSARAVKNHPVESAAVALALLAVAFAYLAGKEQGERNILENLPEFSSKKDTEQDKAIDELSRLIKKEHLAPVKDFLLDAIDRKNGLTISDKNTYKKTLSNLFEDLGRDPKGFIEKNMEYQRKYADARDWQFYKTFIEQVPLIGNTMGIASGMHETGQLEKKRQEYADKFVELYIEKNQAPTGK